MVIDVDMLLKRVGGLGVRVGEHSGCFFNETVFVGHILV